MSTATPQYNGTTSQFVWMPPGVSPGHAYSCHYLHRDCSYHRNRHSGPDPNKVYVDLLAELEQDHGGLMSEEEKGIYDDTSLSDKINYLRSASTAWDKTIDLFGDLECGTINGIGDAFRHAYWKALSVMVLSVELTGQLTTAINNCLSG